MKNIWILFLLAMIASSAKTQNLVPNGDFEQYDTCPDYLNQVYHTIGWENWLASPDYFNVCAPCCAVSVPYNLHNIDPNFQIPHSGSAYAGLFTYWTRALIGPYPYIRDQIGIPINQQMQVGVQYYFTMYVALASFNITPCASSKIGVKFTTQSFASLGNTFTSPLVDNYAPIYVGSLITDSTNWTKVTGSFIADSTYQYLVIGNFFDDFNTDTLIIGTLPLCYAYYLIDDVCLSIDSLTCATQVGIEILNYNEEAKLFPNPANDKTLLELPMAWSNCKLVLFNMMGIREELNFEMSADRRKIVLELRKLRAGIYCLNLFHDNQMKTIKLIINN